MVFCTYCGHSFTRDEHLERHILTHTNVKPFKCFTCHMSFARRDLLQRHYTVHGRDQNQQEIPAANGMIPKSAGRTPIACSNCAKTKTKCDKKFPCSRCSARNLRCTLRPTRRSTKNASRMGLITPETLAAAGHIPPGETLAAEKVITAPMVNSPEHQRPIQIKPASPSQTTSVSADGTISPTATRSSSISNEKPSDAPAHNFEGQTNGAQANHTMLSPFTPGNQFMSQTPMSGFDDFANTSKSSEESSPRFMLDWNQMQMPMGFEQMAGPDGIMSPGLGLDMSGLPLGPNGESMLSMLPELNHSGSTLMTPIETPVMERAFSDMDLSKQGMIDAHNRHMSMASMASYASAQSMPPAPTISTLPTNMNSVPDLGAVIAAQDGWNVFRCTPTIPSSACPTTAKLNLERLEQTLKNHEGWTSWTPNSADMQFAGPERLTVMHLHESTRDKLLAITQSILHKALETHRGSNHSYMGGNPPMGHGGNNFVLLPPARVLEYFLRSYANNFECYYQLTSRGTLDANELMHCYNPMAASLLILMMIAQGAMNIPSTEARWLTGGLTEACRISLFDLVERNINLASDPTVLHAALLFTEQAAWSGDKWQMDIAMGQRGMYSYMLRHSGVLEHQAPIYASNMEGQSNADALWTQWIQQESQSRLVYSWVMVDQDLAIFHDTAPVFNVTEFGAPMPDADRLWQAKNATEWSSLFEQVHDFSTGFTQIGAGSRPLSLRDLFRHFLDDEILAIGIEMTPLQMRLLLHPLQSLVCHYSQLISCFSDNVASRAKNSGVTAASTRCRVEEVQCLLQRWYKLAEHYLKSQPLCSVMSANLVLYHLISLNAVTVFPEIEKLARREAFDGTYQALVWIHKRAIADVNEATFHSGQVLRLIRKMPRSVRPPWWAGAVYRAGLVLWCDSLINNEEAGASSKQFAIDGLAPDHPAISRYLNKREGVPCLTKRDGNTIPIDHGLTVLNHCIEVIDEGASSRFTDGVRGKLDRLMRS